MSRFPEGSVTELQKYRKFKNNNVKVHLTNKHCLNAVKTMNTLKFSALVSFFIYTYTLSLYPVQTHTQS